MIYKDYDEGLIDDRLRIDSLSQEHGKVVSKTDTGCGEFQMNDKIRILPNHSCLTNNLFDRMYIVEDEKVVDIFRIHRGHSLD